MLRRLPILLLALLLATPPVMAQAFKAIAFGDSITVGYGDDPGQGGYPARLQRWLRQRGYDATVVNEGVSGEATPEALARIDGVLDQGGDYLILMEGTNDISRRISPETIRFNLNKLAERGEDRGLRVVHASVIPRIPDAGVDASNEKTSTLADLIEVLAANKFRGFANQFALFESLDSVFDLYYYDDPFDPVGHPNADGYQEMGGLFLETMLEILESPTLQIVPPPPPVLTGTLLSFQAQGGDDFAGLEWDFGDGGWAASEAPVATAVAHLYLAPGSYTVRLIGRAGDGSITEAETVVVVEGAAPAWTTRSALIPTVLEGDGSQLDDVASDLRLQNFDPQLAVAEIALFPEVRLDDPPPPRKVLLAPGSSLEIERVVQTLFGLERTRGSLLVTYFVNPGASTAGLTSFNTLRLAGDTTGAGADTVVEIPAASWSRVQKVVGGIVGSASTTADLAVANLDGQGGYVDLALYDSVGALVDSALFEMEIGAVRVRGLTDLFRKLETRPQPFTAVFLASGIRFSASAVLIDPIAGQVVHLDSSP